MLRTFGNKGNKRHFDSIQSWLGLLRYTTLFMPLPASVLGLMCSFLGDTTYSMYQDVVATLRRSINLEGDTVLNIPSGMTLTSHSAIFAKIIHTVFELA